MQKDDKSVKISHFLDIDGKILQVPSQNSKKLSVIAYLASKFEDHRTYSEKEVNEIINAWHTFGDYFILRRLLIDYGYMERKTNGSEYWRAERTEEGYENG
jgi:hypothetical protein